ncbi:class I SAM-dependent methyltransferase [Ilumatobacter nonamiensis]|uniref:class I SAM-dependent methyltransferase n=1 Tax=Ilumatobacter nonamiensis TaxID=467093 RepID=UPI0003458089|nr:class I SAM-dependent methyltransferase [Ilumatobacter nonamiensis]
MDAKLQRWVQRRGWDRASTCYERYWQQQLQPAIDLVLQTADLQRGEAVIDVACGTGLVALRAAQQVAPTGRVLATDLSPRMIADLSRRARSRAVDNLRALCRDAEDLGDHAPFDVAVCSLGLMYVPDPGVAAAELHRVLRPGGRVVVSVWGERARCGWAELFPIVAARVSSDVCPMFFALGAPGALTSTLEGAGFVDIDETRLAVDLVYGSAEDALGAAFLGGPVALAASRFDDATRRSAHAEYLASLDDFSEGPGYRVPGEFVIASARRVENCRDPRRPTSTNQKGTPP